MRPTFCVTDDLNQDYCHVNIYLLKVGFTQLMTYTVINKTNTYVCNLFIPILLTFVFEKWVHFAPCTASVLSAFFLCVCVYV